MVGVFGAQILLGSGTEDTYLYTTPRRIDARETERVAGVDVRGGLILWKVVWEGLLGEGTEPGELLGPVWRWLSAWEAHSAR